MIQGFEIQNLQPKLSCLVGFVRHIPRPCPKTPDMRESSMFRTQLLASWFVSMAVAVAVAAALMQAPPARAQVCDPGWVPGPMTTASPWTDGPVHAMITYGSPARLYVGGDFSHINGIAAKNIAAWDGVQWSAVGGGCD